MRLRRSLLAVLVIGLGACGARTHAALRPAGPTTTSAPSPTTTSTAAAHPVPRVSIAGAALAPYPSCTAFLDAVRKEAATEVTPYGLPEWMATPGGFMAPGGARPMDGVAAPMPLTAESASGGAPAAAPSASGNAAAAPETPAFSTTNNQETAVDEPDVAKTDGHLLVTLDGGALKVVDVSASPNRLRGSIAAPGQATGLFLLGSEVVVLGSAYDGPPPAAGPAPGPGSGSTPNTHVWVFDLKDPDHPTLARSFTVSGNEVDARLIGHSVKLVVASMPSIAWPMPQPTPAASLAANRAAIASAPLSAWLPTVTDAGGHAHTAQCVDVQHPSEPSGVATISVVSIDPDQAEPGPAVTILGDPGIVYASTSDLYVATNSFSQQQAASEGRPVSAEKTLIHQFDITDPAKAVYRGSGAVPGNLLNQYALSEYNGDLRVATTTGIPSPPPFEGGPVPPQDGSQSMVTVLRPSNGSLITVGQVSGLGLTERIYGVRFVGPLGYVVTYRQMDPLYIVDLSKPTAPQVRGALELTGYSAYLHPVATGRLLGVGAASDSNAHRTGLQVSLFDVSNPDKPSLLSRATAANANAAVESDPHAFLWWPATGLVVLPVQECCAPSDSGGAPFVGAFAYHVDGSSVTQVGRISQPSPPPPSPQPQPYPGPPQPAPSPGGSGAQPGGPSAQPGQATTGPAAGPARPAPTPTTGGAGARPATAPPTYPYPGAPITRVLVVGDRLYSVSESGVLVSDLHSFATVTWLPFS